jgi:hypothetical protein
MGTSGYSLAVGAEGRAVLAVKGAGGAGRVVSRAKVNDGRWHHLLAECDRKGRLLTLYVDGMQDAQAAGIGPEVTLANDADLYGGGTPQGRCLAGTFDFLRIALGTLADAKTSIEELYAWEFDGPFLRDFTGRIDKEISEIQTERDALNLPADLFTSEHCHPHKYEESIDGKVVAIKPEVFAPEYRRGDYQLVLVDGGNGAKADARGNAVFCYHLNSGKHTRFERYEVLGIVKELPDWAKESLNQLQGEHDKPTAEKQFAGRYEIIDRIEAGQKVFALGYNANAPQPYGTWMGYKDSSRGFDMGHYFSTREVANTDLHDRAAQEQKRLDSRKRSDDAR